MGIFLSNVTGTTVMGNVIISDKEELPGIFAESMSGGIRTNIIEGHTSGIHLGNSSPDIGGNIITANKYHGIYIGTGSYPNMEGYIAGSPPVFYPVSGYNKIFENGGWEEENGPYDNDGSEIYFNNSNAVLSRGCNQIYDDREESSPLINTWILMSGESIGFPASINAEYNFWGDTVHSSRFSGIIVDFTPYYTEPCAVPDGSEGGGLLAMTSDGQVIDTLYPAETTAPQLTQTELLYAEAEESFITADYSSADQLYQQIINSQEAIEDKIKAYKRIYETGSITRKDGAFFTDLRNEYLSLASSVSDTLLTKIFTQLASLSLIKKTEIVPAIGEFDNIIQQNPNTEEAIYAEIDAMTAAIMLEGNDTTLQKSKAGKYLVKNRSDYFGRLNEILKQNFGSGKPEAREETLPVEYSLYQNYPNPFNPTTKINYDLPEAGNISLIVYDILGRRVKVLVNDNQQAGRYEVSFNASNLASGVYIYQLRAEKFVSTKKMILLR
jgi:hypothetical protein